MSATGCLPRERHETTGASSASEGGARSSESDKPRVSDKRPEIDKRPPADKSARPGTASEPDPLITTHFKDDFERPTLGANWRATGPTWRISAGQLCAQRSRNHPVWLTHRLPVNARIEFDALTRSEDGDIKAEYWGDGRSAATQVSYEDATSYLTIFGGWKNRFHVLARIDEHAPDRPEIRLDPSSEDPKTKPVVKERSYRFKVERSDGKTVTWWVDGHEMLKFEDAAPLRGEGHEYFAFNNWETHVCFDNLEITAHNP
jgi:hypothetical protein